MRVSRYAVKRSLLSPRVAYLRRRRVTSTQLPGTFSRRSTTDRRSMSSCAPPPRTPTSSSRQTLMRPASCWTSVPTSGSGPNRSRSAITARSTRSNRIRMHSRNCRLASRRTTGSSFSTTDWRERTRKPVWPWTARVPRCSPTVAPSARSTFSFVMSSRVLDSCGIERVDLCKVNIEGGEYDLFDRLIECDWTSRITNLSIQFHEWHPNAYRRRRAIRRALQRTHTEVWNYPFVWELWQARNAT